MCFIFKVHNTVSYSIKKLLYNSIRTLLISLPNGKTGSMVLLLLFSSCRGKVSILSHSLGSVICFDLLCNQLKDRNEGGNVGYWKQNRSKQAPVSSFVLEPSLTSKSPNTNQTTEYEYEKEGKKVSYHLGNPATEKLRDDFPQLLFCVENLFLIGSPLSLFMAVRHLS